MLAFTCSAQAFQIRCLITRSSSRVFRALLCVDSIDEKPEQRNGVHRARWGSVDASRQRSNSHPLTPLE
jgi:hypothetical protein